MSTGSCEFKIAPATTINLINIDAALRR